MTIIDLKPVGDGWADVGLFIHPALKDALTEMCNAIAAVADSQNNNSLFMRATALHYNLWHHD